MGSFRPYMRNDYPEERTSPLTWLLCALVAAYLMQVVVVKVFNGADFLASFLYLSSFAVRDWHLWTLLSYSFLHDTGNLLHILSALLGLYFIGRELLPALGTKRFFTLYGLGALVGGLVWTALHWRSPQHVLLGSSAALSALFIAFSCQNPNRTITFLFLFIPITLPKTKYLAWALAAIDTFGLVFNEILTGTSVVAHSAHLGGMLLGLVFHKVAVQGIRWQFTLPWSRSTADMEAPAWIGKARKTQVSKAAFQVNLTDREQLKAEVDRILDKINSEGFGSLTPDEKKTLDEAKDLLSKH